MYVFDINNKIKHDHEYPTNYIVIGSPKSGKTSTLNNILSVPLIKSKLNIENVCFRELDFNSHDLLFNNVNFLNKIIYNDIKLDIPYIIDPKILPFKTIICFDSLKFVNIENNAVVSLNKEEIELFISIYKYLAKFFMESTNISDYKLKIILVFTNIDMIPISYCDYFIKNMDQVLKDNRINYKNCFFINNDCNHSYNKHTIKKFKLIYRYLFKNSN